MLVLDMAEAELLSSFEESRDAWSRLDKESDLFAFKSMTIEKHGFTYSHIVLACAESIITATLKSKDGRPYALKKG